MIGYNYLSHSFLFTNHIKLVLFLGETIPQDWLPGIFQFPLQKFLYPGTRSSACLPVLLHIIKILSTSLGQKTFSWLEGKQMESEKKIVCCIFILLFLAGSFFISVVRYIYIQNTSFNLKCWLHIFIIKIFNFKVHFYSHSHTKLLFMFNGCSPFFKLLYLSGIIISLCIYPFCVF